MGIDHQASFNLLVWRRSCLFLMLFFSVVAIWLSTLALVGGFEDYEKLVETSLQTPERNASVYPLDADFGNYTIRVFEVSTARVTLKAAWISLMAEYVIHGLTYVALLFNIVSFWLWSSYRWSKRVLYIGWILTFVAPFLVSIVPTRLFIEPDQYDPVADVYYDEFTQQFNVEKKKIEAVDGCQQAINFEGDADQYESIARGLCTGPVSYVRFIPLCDQCDKIGNACDVVTDLLDSGKPQEAVTLVKDACQEFIHFVNVTNSESDLSPTQVELMAVRKQAFKKQKQQCVYELYTMNNS